MSIVLFSINLVGFQKTGKPHLSFTDRIIKHKKLKIMQVKDISSYSPSGQHRRNYSYKRRIEGKVVLHDKEPNTQISQNTEATIYCVRLVRSTKQHWTGEAWTLWRYAVLSGTKMLAKDPASCNAGPFRCLIELRSWLFSWPMPIGDTVLLSWKDVPRLKQR